MKYSQKLLTETKREIAQFKKKHPGPRRPPYSQQIMDNIKILSGEFPIMSLVKNLSISTATIYKAKRAEKTSKGQASVPFRFVEIQHTPTSQVDVSPKGCGKVIMELKTKSGMVISIFE